MTRSGVGGRSCGYFALFLLLPHRPSSWDRRPQVQMYTYPEDYLSSVDCGRICLVPRTIV